MHFSTASWKWIIVEKSIFNYELIPWFSGMRSYAKSTKNPFLAGLNSNPSIWIHTKNHDFIPWIYILTWQEFTLFLLFHAYMWIHNISMKYVWISGKIYHSSTELIKSMVNYRGLLSERYFIASKLDFAVRNMTLKQHSSATVKRASLRFVSSPSQQAWTGIMAGLIPGPSILSITLCPLPQHCLACLGGHACSNGCIYCQCSSVEHASLRLLSTLSHQGYRPGPVAQCQWLFISTYMCGTCNFTITEPKN
jgi:hypothetical protein